MSEDEHCDSRYDAGGNWVRGPKPDTQIVVVDPTTREPYADGKVGEIWVSGPLVAAAYLNKPGLTREDSRL